MPEQQDEQKETKDHQQLELLNRIKVLSRTFPDQRKAELRLQKRLIAEQKKRLERKKKEFFVEHSKEKERLAAYLKEPNPGLEVVLLRGIETNEEFPQWELPYGFSQAASLASESKRSRRLIHLFHSFLKGKSYKKVENKIREETLDPMDLLINYMPVAFPAFLESSSIYRVQMQSDEPDDCGNIVLSTDLITKFSQWFNEPDPEAAAVAKAA